MKRFFKVLFLVILVVAGVLFGIRVYQQWQVKTLSSTVYELPENYEELPVVEAIVDYVIDMNDLNAYAGIVDYIFVGKVEEITGVTYNDVGLIYHDFPIAEIDGFPQTGYKITVLENIKGELKKDITLTQGSGPVIGKKQMDLIAGPIMKENDVRIFMAYTDNEGGLHVGEAPGIVSLGNLADSERYPEFRETEQVKETVEKYIEAYKNQDTSYRFRERKLSAFDASVNS